MPSRPFDPQWTTDLPSLQICLNALCNMLSCAENRRRARREDARASFEAAIHAIVLDLYRSYATDDELEVGIPSGTTALEDLSKSRYGASFISARPFRDALQILQDKGLIERSTSFWRDPNGRRGRVARYRALPPLVVALNDSGASLAALRRRPNAEGIRLKDCNKKLVEYGDIQFANEARDRLRIINNMLESQWADLALPDEQLETWRTRVRGKRDDEATQPFDFASRTLYRIFNNNDWKQGGRFYGAWWISVPSELRRYVLIDGKRTVEVDYSGLHAAMLFAEAGMKIPDDPYAHCLTKAGDKKERALVKQTFNALLNARNVNAVQPIKGYAPQHTGKSWNEFKRFIVSCYPKFSQHFGSGVGLRLQYKDSQLAEKVMLKFAMMGYACLPVHDSFIVHHGLQDDLTQTMQAVFEDMFGTFGAVGFDIGFGESVNPSSEFKSITAELDFSFCGREYEKRLQCFYDIGNLG